MVDACYVTGVTCGCFAGMLLVGRGGSRAALTPARSAAATRGSGAPLNRRCIAISGLTLASGMVTSSATDTCVLAGQTFSAVLYERGKSVDSQEGPCVCGCTLVITYTCKKKKAMQFYAAAKSNKFPEVKTEKVRLACR